jgi:hypothetical protein
VSIIYEALKKTQRNREVRNMPARERVAARNLDWLDKSLVAFIVLLVLFIMYLYLPQIVKHKKVQPVAVVATPAAVVTARVAAPAVVNEAPQTAIPATASNLILNGVLLSTNVKVALINNKTFHGRYENS